MSDRPTPASVTDVACQCKYLQRAADSPDVPIVFDERVNEFHFVYPSPSDGGSAILNIYHCPFCGGVAPASKRRLLFHVVGTDEQNRLAALLLPLRSLQQIIEALGTPNQDDPIGSVDRLDESDDSPSQVVPCRMLTYKSLSSVADVRVFVQPDGTVGWGLSGKYIGSHSA